MNDCWNQIGVAGDNSCPELAQAVHCRNCRVYSAAAVQLLDRALPPGYRDEWTAYLAKEKENRSRQTESVLIFRLGTEWLALPTAVLEEIAEKRTVHSLPHRRSEVLQGLANVRGKLLLCVRMERLLNVTRAQAAEKNFGGERFLVLRKDKQLLAAPVDEVQGVHRYHPQDLQAVPATVAKALAHYTTGVLPWQDKRVGCLDGRRLFEAFNQNLA